MPESGAQDTGENDDFLKFVYNNTDCFFFSVAQEITSPHPRHVQPRLAFPFFESELVFV